MNYHVETRSYPDFIKEIETLPTIHDTDGMECPTCGGRLDWLDMNMDEKYVEDGFELTERFYCDNCGTFVDATQVYKPAERRILIQQDVFDNESEPRA